MEVWLAFDFGLAGWGETGSEFGCDNWGFDWPLILGWFDGGKLGVNFGCDNFLVFFS